MSSTIIITTVYSTVCESTSEEDHTTSTEVSDAPVMKLRHRRGVPQEQKTTPPNTHHFNMCNIVTLIVVLQFIAVNFFVIMIYIYKNF